MKTITVILASDNPVKIQATLNGFQRMFPGDEFHVETVSVSSGVSSQPMSNEETLQGATNRARRAAEANPNANYWVGIEGGVEQDDGELVAFAWVVVMSHSLTGKGRTGAFFLPPMVTALIRQGKELGEADDIVFGRSNSKQDNGAVGLLTGDVIDRVQLYETAVILALIPFKNVQMYSTAT
jgi:inosine/xanthosine triphosphatase